MPSPASCTSVATIRPTTLRPRLVLMRAKSPTPIRAASMTDGDRRTAPISRSPCALGREEIVARVTRLPCSFAFPFTFAGSFAGVLAVGQVEVGELLLGDRLEEV